MGHPQGLRWSSDWPKARFVGSQSPRRRGTIACPNNLKMSQICLIMFLCQKCMKNSTRYLRNVYPLYHTYIYIYICFCRWMYIYVHMIYVCVYHMHIHVWCIYVHGIYIWMFFWMFDHDVWSCRDEPHAGPACLQHVL